MADTIGIKLGVDGEREFKKAISGINQDMKVLGSEMKAVASQFDAQDKSVRALSERNAVLTKQIETQKEKVEVLREALKNSAESFGENDKRTKNWQIQLNNAEAELNQLNRQLETNKKDMAAAESGTKEETNALKDMGDAADKSGSKLSSFRQALGTAFKGAATAVAAIGTAAVAAGKKIYDLVESTAAAGDETDKNSQKIGISAEAYQEWDYVFQRCGADINNLKGGMKTLSGVISDAVSGSDSARKKLEAVGLSIDDLNGKSQDEQLSIVIAALQNMESGSDRTAAASDLLGKSAVELGAVFNMTAEETAALKKEAEDYGMVMSNEAVKASAAFQDSLTKLNGTITGAKNRLMGELLPGITSVTDGLADLVAGTGDGSKKIKEGIKDIVDSVSDMIPQAVELLGTIANTILENAPVLIESLADGIISVLPDFLSTGLEKVLPQMASVSVKILGKLLNSLIQALPQLMMSLSTTIVELLNTLLSPENIKNAVALLIQGVKSIIAGLQQSLPILIDGAVQLATGLAEALPDVIVSIIDELPNIIKMIFDSQNGLLSTDNINKLINGAADVVLKIVENLPTIIMSLIDAIPDIIDALFDPETGFLSPENLKKLFSSAALVIRKLIEALPGIIKNLLLTIPNIVDSIIGAFGSLLDGFFGLGEGAGENFIRGFLASLAQMGGMSGEMAKLAFGSSDYKSSEYERIMKNYYNIDASVTINSDGTVSITRDQDALANSVSMALAAGIQAQGGVYR